MSVDLSKAKAGDLVHWRSGECAFIREIKPHQSEEFGLLFYGFIEKGFYLRDGKEAFGTSDLDLVKVEAK